MDTYGAVGLALVMLAGCAWHLLKAVRWLHAVDYVEAQSATVNRRVRRSAD